MLKESLTTESARDRQLRDAVEKAVERYVERNPLSLAHHMHARNVLPGGNTRSVLYYDPFPLTFEKGKGAYLYSLDGDRYIDFLGEFTAGLYGHSNPVILARLDEALQRGISYGGHNQYEAELAAEVCKRVPSVNLVRFTNSGTEANLLALATAIVHTQRQKVLVFEGAYHGGLLTFSGPAPLNVPHEFVLARYNDTENVRSMIREHATDLAAVLVEPMMGAGGCIPAEQEFLEMLRQETTSSGSILIFDEVMTSRLSAGGLQEVSGVIPDMTTLGKYIGGGMSFGAFGGRAELLARYNPAQPGALQHAGTFNNNLLTMAAGATGLRELYTPTVAIELSQRGETLRARLNELFVESGAKFQVTGRGSVMSFHATRQPIRSWSDLASADRSLEVLLFHHMLANGIWLAARGMMSLCLPLTDNDLGALVDATGAFVTEYRELVAASD